MLSLALQGGGAHGAFTWGVLDRLLEEPGFRFEAVSGTSAGAMNAVVLASGWLSGGPDGAREALSTFWDQVAEAARPLRHGGVPRLVLDLATHLFSPHQLNPLGINPMRRLIESLVDFERLRGAAVPRLFIAATNLRTGQARIFENRDLSIDAVLASAALPQVHQAVEIGGEIYWDGGYVSNPPITPLVERCRAADLLLVQVNPSQAASLPTSASEIRNRIGEIVFGAPLQNELRLLDLRAALARRSIMRLLPSRRRLTRHRRHLIDGSAFLARLDPLTKVIPDRATQGRLRDCGRAAAEAWLNGGAIQAAAEDPALSAPLRRSA
jgi:NTE family protein